MMVQNRELKGKGSRFNGLPAAKAYDGPLPAGKAGVEFWTDIRPHDHTPGRKSPTGRVFWYEKDGATPIDVNYVKIAIVVTKYVPKAP